MKVSKLIQLLSLIALGAALAACGNDSKTDTANAVATVNGEGISQDALAAYAETRTGTKLDKLDDQLRNQVIEEMINIRLLAQKAAAEKLDEKDPLKAQLAFQRENLMANAAMTEYLEAHPVTDEEMQAEYDKRKDQLGGTEYKASHILLKTEAEANDVLKQLHDGADFAELAKKKSIEPGADKSGGSLGWFSANQMVAPFSKAVESMTPGSISETPVQTQFGWHVIKLEDTRTTPPPSFDSVKPQIKRFMSSQRVQDYLSELRKTAKISKPEMKTDAAEQAMNPEAKPADDKDAAAESSAKDDKDTKGDADGDDD